MTLDKGVASCNNEENSFKGLFTKGKEDIEKAKKEGLKIRVFIIVEIQSLIKILDINRIDFLICLRTW